VESVLEYVAYVTKQMEKIYFMRMPPVEVSAYGRTIFF